MTSSSDPTTLSTPASLMGKVPITLFMRNGTLELARGRLSFTTNRGTTLFDHPVDELHSVRSVSRVGMRVAHGDRKYTLVPCYQRVSGVNTTNDLVDVAMGVAQLSRSMKADQRMRAARDAWIDVLRQPVPQPVS